MTVVVPFVVKVNVWLYVEIVFGIEVQVAVKLC